ncbi:phospholipase D family protein [Massilia sp. B-10]|nr:phospholipase D family protein [Massilia sp. B-10]
MGIDLQGTSREVFEELLKWPCQVNIFHNNIGRSTFHPKIYLFEGQTSATVFVGSNNFTEGGFYSNYEASVRGDFSLPLERTEFINYIRPLHEFLTPETDLAKNSMRNCYPP